MHQFYTECTKYTNLQKQELLHPRPYSNALLQLVVAVVEVVAVEEEAEVVEYHKCTHFVRLQQELRFACYAIRSYKLLSVHLQPQRKYSQKVG